jgi:colanic acid/amylovoran biosynthesis glycosyltransferase
VRIIYITSKFPFDRAETFLWAEIDELRRQRHEILLVPMRGGRVVNHEDARPLLVAGSSDGVVSWRLAWQAARAARARPQHARRAVAEALTVIPRHLLKNLAVVPKGLWLAELAQACGANHIHAHWAATTASMAMIASTVSGVPWSFTAHRWDIVENNLLARKAEHAVFVRFISRKSLEMACARGLPAQARAVVLPMGVRVEDVSGRTGRHNESSKDRPFRFIMAASLIGVKGHKYMLQAIARNLELDFEVWFAGDGFLRNDLEVQARALGVTRHVRFLGHVAHDALLGFYREGEIDAAISASVDLGNGLHEGIPVALIEAMAHGRPVIGTRSGAIPELLDGHRGVLIPPADPKALAEAMRRLVCEPDLCARLGEAGRRHIEKRFAVERVVTRLVDCFRGGIRDGNERCINRRRSPSIHKGSIDF